MISLCAFADEAATSLSGQIRALKRNNIYKIEIRNIHGTNVLDITEEDAKRYTAELDKNQIEVWSIGSPLGKIDISCDFEDYKKNIHHICRLANIFKTAKVRVFSFFNAYGQPDKVFKYLNQMVDIAKDYGVTLYHENEKDIYGDNLARVLQIMQSVQGLKFIYDPANFLQVGESPQLTLAALVERTDYFHIKDVIKRTGELVPAGYGDCDISSLIDNISTVKVLTLEPHLAVFEGYDKIDRRKFKNKFEFGSNADAFDAAVKALKDILVRLGYKEHQKEFVK